MVLFGQVLKETTMKSLLFIQAGGTIDKEYPPGATHHGYNFEIGEPALTLILARALIRLSWMVVTACRKDSLDMDDADRKAIQLRIAESKRKAVVVTHGTDTMSATAKYLSGKFPGRTIIIVGARLPEAFKRSDADFNLGFAIALAQTLPAGVYVAEFGSWKKY